MGSIGQNSTFSEHGHVAYQIKGNHEKQHGNKYFARRPLLPLIITIFRSNVLLIFYIRGEKKGVMVPPVIIDMDGDSIDDLLISVYEGLLVLKNGKDLTDMWTVSFPNMESYW